MRMRTTLTSIAAITLVLTWSIQPCQAGIQWARPYLSGMAGYDTNVGRRPADALPAGTEIEGDGRAVVLASVGLTYEHGERLLAALEARPYLVNYFNSNEYDRTDVFAAGEVYYQWSDRWSLELPDQFRYTYFTGRDFDRVYNSIEPAVVLELSRRWEVSAQYRYMYRDNPRRIIDWWQASGVGGSVGVDASDRLSLELFGRVDFQKQQFVFPRDNSGKRYWADLSGRYLLGSRTLLMGKYLFQVDDMEVKFSPGLDFDRFGDPADDFADGILQSLRFMEDTSNNYRKHLFVLLSHTSVHEGTFIEAFLLYQHQRFDQGVIQLPDRPQRLDQTYVAQAYVLSPLGHGLSLLGTLRYEQNDSNDPLGNYRFTILSAGLKWAF